MTYTWPARICAAEPSVWLALSDHGGVYAETAAAIRAVLQRSGVRADLVVKPWREFTGVAEPAPRLTVAIGVGALRGLAESPVKGPLLAVLVPRAVYARFAAEAGPALRPHSAVWLDQPITRQLELLQLALPARRRVGLLLGPESRLLEGELLSAMMERGFEPVIARLDGAADLPAALQRTLDGVDVLLALPEPQVYNGVTIQNILTSAYRRRIPLAGFSPAYVKAGALLAVYSTPAQIGAQAGDIVASVLAGRGLASPRGPRDFSVAVNLEVARSLGLALEADAAAKWTERLKEHGQ